MKDVPAPGRFAPTALMLGNFVTGCSVLAPAGMLGELSAGLDVTIRNTGLLITFGAVVLCIGSPLTAWLTSRIERRSCWPQRSACWRSEIRRLPLHPTARPCW
jgi:MFS transporter, DHA1 family, inner membrane transport protein